MLLYDIFVRKNKNNVIIMFSRNNNESKLRRMKEWKVIKAINKYHYNVAEAQLELHRRNMEWCIGAIAQARNKHVDVEPELDYRPNITW